MCVCECARCARAYASMVSYFSSHSLFLLFIFQHFTLFTRCLSAMWNYLIRIRQLHTILSNVHRFEWNAHFDRHRCIQTMHSNVDFVRQSLIFFALKHPIQMRRQARESETTAKYEASQQLIAYSVCVYELRKHQCRTRNIYASQCMCTEIAHICSLCICDKCVKCTDL